MPITLRKRIALILVALMAISALPMASAAQTITYPGTALRTIVSPGSYAFEYSLAPADESGNTVTVTGNNSGDNLTDVFGSYSAASPTNGNTVNIRGGYIGRAVYGGYSYTNDASYNTVNISGGVIESYVTGGYCQNQNNFQVKSVHNTINLSGSPQIRDVLFGGWGYPRREVCDYFTGNKLNATDYLGWVEGLNNFEQIKFDNAYMTLTGTGYYSIPTLSGVRDIHFNSPSGISIYTDHAVSLNFTAEPSALGDNNSWIVSGAPFHESQMYAAKITVNIPAGTTAAISIGPMKYPSDYRNTPAKTGNWEPRFLPEPIVSGPTSSTPTVRPSSFPGKGAANANGVKVRAGASTKTKALGKLGKNNEVTVLGYENGFFKIAWDNEAGFAFVSADYVLAAFGAPLDGAAKAKLTLYSKMSARSKYKLGSFEEGTPLSLLTRHGKWWRVKAGELEGYAQANKITVN